MAKDGKPFLQGWAVVDNPTADDWNSVGMALISGRPISFQMDLYQPLYVPRPMVELELFQSLRPVAYGGAMPNKKMVHDASVKQDDVIAKLEEAKKEVEGERIRRLRSTSEAWGNLPPQHLALPLTDLTQPL